MALSGQDLARHGLKLSILLLIVLSVSVQTSNGGVIKDIFQKVTNTNNKTEDVVKESAPICGSGAFSTPDEASLSPQMIFITNAPNRVSSTQSGSSSAANSDSEYSSSYSESSRSERRRGSNSHNTQNTNYNNSNNNYDQSQNQAATVAKEYTFHVDNVTLRDLEERGFNRKAPVTFLMHGFTSGYPLQTWISAMVDAYTIDRELQSSGRGSTDPWGSGSQYGRDKQERRRPSSSGHSGHGGNSDGSVRQRPVDHNLFIINWNYAARGILYPRAVANIPIVASYVTRFINDKLIDEARVDPNQIKLVGHSLGAHLAGYIGKNTDKKVGQIYGLDPAGPCFGTLVAGSLFPASKRLAPSDAQEVITVQTNSALLGHDKPLGRYSIYVEGGANQPGCKGGGVLKSLNALTWDGADFDQLSCSHSRAPNLLTYRHDQTDQEDSCQLVAYACKDWDTFLAGQCGVCNNGEQNSVPSEHASSNGNKNGPMQAVQCKRLGLEWQYYKGGSSSSGHSTSSSNYGNSNHGSNGGHSGSNNEYGGSGSNGNHHDDVYSSSSNNNHGSSNYNYGNSSFNHGSSSNHNNVQSQRERNPYNNQSSQHRDKRETIQPGERRASNQVKRDDDKVEPISMFLRTGDTQPYCTFQYQIILELNEKFPNVKDKPPMSIILQDSGTTGEQQRNRRPPSSSTSEQNSISDDAFGNKFDDRTYTHLLTSNRKIKKVDHGTLIFRDGLENGHRILKALHVNYMSHSDPRVRSRFSSRLCPVRTENDRPRDNSQLNRFYFEPCDKQQSSGGSYSGSSSSSSSNHHANSDREDSFHSDNNSNYNYASNSTGYHKNKYNSGQDNDRDSSSHGHQHNKSDGDSYSSVPQHHHQSSNGQY